MQQDRFFEQIVGLDLYQNIIDQHSDKVVASENPLPEVKPRFYSREEYLHQQRS